MSDERPDTAKPADEQAIDRVLAALESASESALPRLSDLDEEAQTFGRLYVEAVALLPMGLEAVKVRPELRERVLEAVRGEPASRRVVPIGRGADEAAADAGSRPSRAGARSIDKAYVTGGYRPVQLEATAPRARRWPLALAAAATLAFASLAGWLFVQLEEQRSQGVRLEARIRSLTSETQALRASQTELARTRDAFEIVTSRGATVCSLRPVQGSPASPGSGGVLYADAGHQRWYLVVEGLQPMPSEREYQLWFLVDGRPVSGGTFAVRAGQRAELGSKTMPAGTNAIAITIEPRGGLPLPTGPMVLLGDRLQSL